MIHLERPLPQPLRLLELAFPKKGTAEVLASQVLAVVLGILLKHAGHDGLDPSTRHAHATPA